MFAYGSSSGPSRLGYNTKERKEGLYSVAVLFKVGENCRMDWHCGLQNAKQSEQHRKTQVFPFQVRASCGEVSGSDDSCAGVSP